MTTYYFSNHLLMRTPSGNIRDYLSGDTNFLKDAFFLSALYLASPVFYRQLERSGFDRDLMTEKELNSLRKYVNRYCFRPTPFGLFASVSLVNWDTENILSSPSHENLTPVIEPDQDYTTAMGKLLQSNWPQSLHKYEGNPSLYRAMNEFRFFRTGTDEQGKTREYLLQSTDYSKLVKDLVAFCIEGKSREDIIIYIATNANCSEEEAMAYFEFLTDAQLLVGLERQQITGKNYLERLSAIYPLFKPINSALKQLRAHKTNTPHSYEKLQQQLKNLLPELLEVAPKEHLSVILLKKNTAQSLDNVYQEQIGDGLFALQALCPETKNPAIEDFIRSFQQHFEGQTIPLLSALDPETGIGYQSPNLETGNPLLETLNIQPRLKTEHNVAWSAAHSYLMDLWKNGNSNDLPEIRLEKQGLTALINSRDNSPILGMSVLFRIINKKVFLESAGGVNAPALMGRFTVADRGIENAAIEMARHTEKTNPDLLFAELLHLSDPHTDNINRRRSVWSWDIPITAGSPLGKKHQIPLSDLFISIENGKIILRSKVHGKVVVPRLTSAYNHSLNKLPLFRFLADLPYQYGNSSLSLDLRHFFPNLAFYPRVTYGTTVLHLATWILKPQQRDRFQQADNNHLPRIYNEIGKDLRLPNLFTLTEGDQQLVFRRDDPNDSFFLAACIRNKKEVVFKEFLAENSEQGLLRDSEGKIFVSQFNAYLLPVVPLEIGSYQEKTKRPIRQKRKFIPGSEWLYLKIYSSRIGAGRLLLKLMPLIRRKYCNGTILKWFFIRYEDHAPHIRLRLQINPLDTGEVLMAFKEKLEDRIHQHVIREYQVDVYSRELERYSEGSMELTEDFFCQSSELVISFLKTPVSGSSYLFGMISIESLLDIFIPDKEEQLQFTLSRYLGFLPEFENKTIKTDLDKKYRELSPEIQFAFQQFSWYQDSGILKPAEKYKRSLRRLYLSIKEKEIPAYDLSSSLIHMHLNRLFTDESRKQEMIVYYLLYKYKLSEKGRKKRS